MSGVTKVSLYYFRWYKICFERKTRYQKVTNMRRRYCVRWVWGIKKYMHALMIAYYTNISMKKCINAPGVGHHGTK